MSTHLQTRKQPMGTKTFPAQNQARPSPATPPNFFASFPGAMSQNHMGHPQNATSPQAPPQRLFFLKTAQNLFPDSQKSPKNHQNFLFQNPTQPTQFQPLTLNQLATTTSSQNNPSTPAKLPPKHHQTVPSNTRLAPAHNPAKP
ncbi:hypothetical protein BH09VER1_BH09VER1_35440 [soil metagenome]